MASGESAKEEMEARHSTKSNDARSQSNICEAALEEGEALLREMEDLEDYYFGMDRGHRMQKIADSIGTQMDVVLSTPGLPPAARSRACFIKGRAASLSSGQESVAEQLLSKAIKLDPCYVRAWNALGEVFWNQHNIAQAKHCFEQAINFCGRNAVSLRNLSMTLRAQEDSSQVGGNDLDSARRRSENYSKALELSKEAVALDAQDPQNWETLGNAYVGSFFANAKHLDEMSRALIAYEKAEAACTKLGKRNPTLPLNQAKVAKFLEDYDLAIRCYQKAADIGAPGAREEGQVVLELVQRLAVFAEKKGKLKAKTVKELTSDFPRSSSGAPEGLTLQAALAASGAQGAGTGAGLPLPPKAHLMARVVLLVERREEVPVILACCDAVGDFFAVSIYNAEFAKVAGVIVPMKSMLRIQMDHSRCRQVSVNCAAGNALVYPCIRVSCPAAVGIVGYGSLASAAVQATFSSTAGPVSADGSTTETTATTSTTTCAKKAEAKVPPPPKENSTPNAAAPQSSGRRANRTGKAAHGTAKTGAKFGSQRRTAAHHHKAPPTAPASLADHQRALAQLSARGEDRASVIQALVPALRSAVAAELEWPVAEGRLDRIEQMFEAVGRGDVHCEETTEFGQRYAPGWVSGLSPNTPFHETASTEWCDALTSRWLDIRSELQAGLERESIWLPGIYTDAAAAAEEQEWRLAGILLDGEWQRVEQWPKTIEVIKSLPALTPYEAFFARLPAHTSIAPHSDNLNYILTACLTLKAAPRKCKLKVGNRENVLEEGKVVIFDTTYIHSAQNDSDEDRYVLVLRYWHPDISMEERLAIQMAHALLSGSASAGNKVAESRVVVA